MTKFCPECGTRQRDENNHFCSNCGFDFSKIENQIESRSSDDSIVNVPISSEDGSVVSKPRSSVSKNESSPKQLSSVSTNKNANSTKTGAVNNSANSVGAVNNSANRTRAANNSNSRTKKISAADGFLSNLSFNKCFLAFAVLLVFLVIVGMISNSTQEPYSDDGLTSFMERSDYYDLNDFLEDSSNDNYYSDDYLQYGGDGESDLIPGSLL